MSKQNNIFYTNVAKAQLVTYVGGPPRADNALKNFTKWTGFNITAMTNFTNIINAPGTMYTQLGDNVTLNINLTATAAAAGTFSTTSFTVPLVANGVIADTYNIPLTVLHVNTSNFIKATASINGTTQTLNIALNANEGNFVNSNTYTFNMQIDYPVAT